VTKEPPALPEKGTETSIAPSPKEGVGVSGAIVQRQGGPLEGADLLEMDYFYREKTYELNKQIKGHIPDASPEAVRYVGTNKPTKTRPALPLFQDNHFTGSSFTLQKNPKGHVNEGLWETPYEALVRKRAQFENYPVKPPHELTYEQFSKGPSITDPTSPIRKHALPALKIGDEYAVGYNATTHLGVYEELMNEGSWPVNVPLEKAESAWVVNGKGVVADPGATMKIVHRTLVEDAYKEGKVIPKAVKEQYPDIFEREAIDRAKAVDDQMVDLANDMETWEGTRNIYYDDKGQFVRRAKATYPPWFKKVFKQDSKGFVADTINRYQFAKSKGVKNPFPNQPRRNRVIDTLKEVIKDSVESGKHIVEEGYAARLLKSEEGFFSVNKGEA
jgi:hypothetical protein